MASVGFLSVYFTHELIGGEVNTIVIEHKIAN